MDEEQECTEEIRHPDPAMLEILDRNLTFQYPFAEAEKLPSKLTATELKDQDPDAAALLRRGKSFSGPDLSGERISAARVGTATHLVLQQIDFGKTDSKENIRNEIDRLREQRFLNGEEARAVDVAGVRAFFESELGRRVLHAEKVWREFRFSLLTEARELLPVESEGDKVLLQGVADCFFLEEGGLVLADYKTDRVGPDDVMARAEYYRVQLDTYAKALERIFRMPVKEKYLYFLSLRKTIRL